MANYERKNTEIRTYYTDKNDLVGLNSNSGGKWINQNFLITIY